MKATMKKNSNCPNDDVLMRYYRNELDLETFTKVQDHLTTCNRCTEYLKDLAVFYNIDQDAELSLQNIKENENEWFEFKKIIYKTESRTKTSLFSNIVQIISVWFQSILSTRKLIWGSAFGICVLLLLVIGIQQFGELDPENSLLEIHRGENDNTSLHVLSPQKRVSSKVFSFEWEKMGGELDYKYELIVWPQNLSEQRVRIQTSATKVTSSQIPLQFSQGQIYLYLIEVYIGSELYKTSDVFHFTID